MNTTETHQEGECVGVERKPREAKSLYDVVFYPEHPRLAAHLVQTLTSSDVAAKIVEEYNRHLLADWRHRAESPFIAFN